MAIYGYLRVSTAGQAESGAGLAAQEDACRKVAGHLDGLFVDAGVSGSTGMDQRPGLLAAVAVLRKGDTLITAKRDRLGRDLFVVLSIEREVARKGACLVSAAGEGSTGTDPTDTMMRGIVTVFAQFERDLIRARTRAALQAKKARRERTGAVPYGFSLAADGVHLVPDEREQEILRLVRLLREGGLSLRAIAAELAARGYQPRGSAWNPKTISSIVEATHGKAA